MNKTIIFFCILFMQSMQGQEFDQGIVAVPLAHLVGQPIGDQKAYQTLPACGGSHNPYLSCPRIHQLLLHEQVTIIKEEGDEVLIDIPHVFFVTESTKVPQTRYWTSKKNIFSYKQLKRNKVDLSLLPKPINFQKPNSLCAQPEIVTLLKPVYDASTELTYSAGTRFIIKRMSKDQKYIYVHALHPKTGRLREMRLLSRSLIKTPCASTQEKIKTFVDILKLWAHQENGFIPYIWGGCSFTHLESSPTILHHTQNHNSIIHSWYTRQNPDRLNATLHSGFDCAGLVVRAAQMAGIPFFFKNTLTIAHSLQEIEKKDSLNPGDIIWIRGHVMVVADTSKNSIIEARGYDADYGRVHEIEISKVFEGIKTFEDLKRTWLEKKPLTRLDKSGKVQDQFKTVKLLNLKSVFKNS